MKIATIGLMTLLLSFPVYSADWKALVGGTLIEWFWRSADSQ